MFELALKSVNKGENISDSLILKSYLK